MQPPASQSPGHRGHAAPRSLVITIVALFFIWGGLTSLNDVLIPKLKGLFALSYTEAMLTQFAFFTAYFIVSLPAGVLIARVGYVKGIVIGLVTMALGCLLFMPASTLGVYAVFLAALFVLAAGITILQVAANPLIAQLGSAATSHSRLTLAQAFNSLGTTLFPPLGAMLILGAATDGAAATDVSVVGETYLAMALVLAAIAVFFWIRHRRLSLHGSETITLGGALPLLGRPRLGFGVAAIFIYVGAEVSIGSGLINYLTQATVLGVSERAAGTLIAFYWGGAMLGRFCGAYLLTRFNPGAVLASFAGGAVLLVSLSGLSQGWLAGYALLAVGLMNSIMFPTIFSLSVEGLGLRTPQGSGLLCMAIVGGALIPLLFGAVADATSLSVALVVPMTCYLLICAYGWWARRPAAELT